MGKVALVTGASSGLGLAVANHLSQSGYTVYAGARSFGKDINEQGVKNGHGLLYKLYLDVTNQESVEHTLDVIKKREGKLDILVNCAAFLVLGAVEETSVEEFRGVLETNFLGTVRMCKNVVPLMREQKSGLIVNFSSINGVLGIPFQSAYVSSKFAIEGMTECLRMEVKDFGINVTMVEPSDHRSGSKNYRPHAKGANADSPYYEKHVKVTDKINHDEHTGSDPKELANFIYRITLKRKPKIRYTVGKFDQRLSTVLKRVLPGKLFEKIIYSYYI